MYVCNSIFFGIFPGTSIDRSFWSYLPTNCVNAIVEPSCRPA